MLNPATVRAAKRCEQKFRTAARAELKCAVFTGGWALVCVVFFLVCWFGYDNGERPWQAIAWMGIAESGLVLATILLSQRKHRLAEKFRFLNQKAAAGE